MGEEGSKPTWHFSRGGKQYGPISDHELLKLTELGKLRPDDLLWKPGFATWQTAQSIPGPHRRQIVRPALAFANDLIADKVRQPSVRTAITEA